MSLNDLRVLAVLIREGLASLKHRTAVQPLLWACAVVTVPCFWIATKTDGWLRVLIASVGSIPVILLAIAYIFFMLKAPERLHSEEFQLKSRSLATVESKGGIVSIKPLDLAPTSDPEPSPKDKPPPKEGKDDA